MSRKGPNSVLIISARFYEDIADELSRGATEELRGNDVEFEDIVRVLVGCIGEARAVGRPGRVP